MHGAVWKDLPATCEMCIRDRRNQVKEITLDMAGSMQKIAKRCFPRAMQVVDRFHVSKSVSYTHLDVYKRQGW